MSCTWASGPCAGLQGVILKLQSIVCDTHFVQSFYFEFSVGSGEDCDFFLFFFTKAVNANKVGLPLHDVTMSPLVLLMQQHINNPGEFNFRLLPALNSLLR